MTSLLWGVAWGPTYPSMVRNGIQVDAFQNTTAEDVFALGDVCGVAELTPGTPVSIARGWTNLSRTHAPSNLPCPPSPHHFILLSPPTCSGHCGRSQAGTPSLRAQPKEQARVRLHPHGGLQVRHSPEINMPNSPPFTPQPLSTPAFPH